MLVWLAIIRRAGAPSSSPGQPSESRIRSPKQGSRWRASAVLRPELPNGSEIRYHSRHFRSHLEKSRFTGRGVPSMCDYSLHHVTSRPAKVGDKLVTTPFNNSITRGFAAVGEPNVAVCLLPGTEVAFEKEIEFERGFGLFSTWRREKRIGDKVARFRQLNADKPNMHHDALEFP